MLRPTADHQFSFVHLSPSKPISQFIPNVQGMFYQCSPLKTEARCVFGIIFIRYTHNQNIGKPIHLKVFGYRIAKIGYGHLCQGDLEP